MLLCTTCDVNVNPPISTPTLALTDRVMYGCYSNHCLHPFNYLAGLYKSRMLTYSVGSTPPELSNGIT